jgi:hypothetical protein
VVCAKYGMRLDQANALIFKYGLNMILDQLK